MSQTKNWTWVRLLQRYLGMAAIASLLAPHSNAQDPTQTFASPATQVQLVELYTSEGCSSCPPADTWLSKYKDNEQLWKAVVPVAYHVDYWDYLGWSDPFALAASVTLTGAQVELVALRSGQRMQVRAGENRGRLLEHNFVAGPVQRTALVWGDGAWVGKLSPQLNPDSSALAFWVITSQGDYLQATGGWLASEG